MELVKAANRFKVFSVKHARFLALGVCLTLSITLTILRGEVTTLQPGKKIDLDTSWFISLPVLFRQGDLLGRDVFFPHGPFSQMGGALNSLGNGSILAQFGQSKVVDALIGVLIGGLCIWLLTPLGWKHILLIYGTLAALDILSEPGYFRSFLVILSAIVLARAVAAPTPARKFAIGALCGLLCLTGQLLTFDQGLYNSFSALSVLVFFLLLNLLVKVFPALHPHKDLPTVKDCLLILGGVAGVFLGGNLLVSLYFLATGPTYRGLFDYQYFNLETVRGFNSTMGLAWRESWVTTGLLLALVIYLVGFVLVGLRRLSPAHLPLVVCLVIFALPPLKSAVTRSDWGHVAYGSLSLIFAFIVLGFSLSVAPVFRYAWYILLALLLLFWPTTLLTSAERLGETLGLSTRPKVELTSAYLAQQLPSGLNAAADPAKAQLDFPYDNFLAIGLGRRLFAPVVQTYAAHTEALQRKYVELLDRSKNEVEIVYGLDDLAVDRLDDVQSISRVPGIFDYIYRNYQLKTSQIFGGGYLLLQPRAQPRPALAGQKLAFQLISGGHGWSYRLDKTASCSLLRLTLNVGYPPYSLLGRPEAFHLTVRAGDQPVKQADIVPIETGRQFSTYFQLVEPSEFASLFGDGLVPARSWDMLEFTTRQTGLFGIAADRFELQGVECISLAAPTLSGQDADFPPGQPGLWQTFSLQPVPSLMVGQDQILDYVIVGRDPRLVLTRPLNLCLADYSHFYVRVSASADITSRQLKIYYRLNAQPDFDEQHTVTLTLAKNEVDQVYLYDLSFLGLDKQDRLTGLRFDPVIEGASGSSPNRLHLLDFRLLRNREPGGCP